MQKFQCTSLSIFKHQLYYSRSPKTTKEILTALASIATTDTVLIDEESSDSNDNDDAEIQERITEESENSEEVMSETSVSIEDATSLTSSRNSINSEE